MILNPMPLKHLVPYVYEAYYGDEELLEKYHVKKCDLKEAVAATVEMIAMTSQEIEITNYGVCMDDGVAIGYLSIGKNNLYSFGINIAHRTKDILKEFWESINWVLKDGFICTLYPNNTRAINWLVRSGMEISNTVTLIKNKDE